LLPKPQNPKSNFLSTITQALLPNFFRPPTFCGSASER